jgi:hypothetical protein
VSDLSSYLIANNDYTVVSCWDATDTPLPTLLNRPAPALYDSSFMLPLDELLRLKHDGSHTHHIGTAHLLQLCFFRLSFDLVFALLEHDAPQLRKQLPLFQQVLSDMKLIVSSDALQGFDAQHWRMCFLLFDCAACIVECVAHTARHLESAPSARATDSSVPPSAASSASPSDTLCELTVRWSSVQRQLALLSFNVDALTRSIAERFFVTAEEGTNAQTQTTVSEEERAVVYGEGGGAAASVSSSVMRAADPRALRDAATFAQFAALWLTVAVQAWAAVIPNKKAMKKAQHKKPSAASTVTPAVASSPAHGEAAAVEADPLTECVLSVRVALATLIHTHQLSLRTLLALCKRLAGRAKATPALLQPATIGNAPRHDADAAGAAAVAAASSASSSSSASLAHRSSVRALQSEHSTLVHAVLSNLDSSHGHTASYIGQCFVALDAPLQQVKL